MRGVVYIEQENSDGDRRIAETIDVEGLLSETDINALLKARCQLALNHPAVFSVKALHDDGWIIRSLMRVTV